LIEDRRDLTQKALRKNAEFAEKRKRNPRAWAGHRDSGEDYILPRSLRSAATYGVAAPVGMTARSDGEVAEAAAPEG
jgi:hypothetical protein